MDIRQETKQCSNNAFCGSLSPNFQIQLCKHCVKTTFAARTSVRANLENILLPLKGLCCVENKGSIISILKHGNFFIFPTYSNDPYREFRPLVTDDYDLGEIITSSKIVAVTDAICAVFNSDVIMKLLTNQEFSMAMQRNTFGLLQQLVIFNIEVYRTDAYHAVRFILCYAKSQGLGRLTHAQIAYLTGLGRSTVTQAMHELAIAEPKVLEGL